MLIRTTLLTAALAILGSAIGSVAAQNVSDSPPSGAHPHGSRTGVPVVDEILDAVESNRSLLGHLQFVERTCETEPQDGGFRCPDGVEDGTVLESVFSGTCEAPSIAASNQAGLERAFGEIGSQYYLFGVGRRSSGGTLGTPAGVYYTLYLVTGPGPAADAFIDRYVRLYVGDFGIFGRSACSPLGIALADEPEMVLGPPGGHGEFATPEPPVAGRGMRGAEDGDFAWYALAAGVLFALLGGIAIIASRRL